MDKMLKETKAYYDHHYFEEEISERIKHKVFGEIKGNYQMKKKSNKLLYVGAALVLCVALLIGSAFYLPGISAVLAKIPVLNMLFEKDSSILEIIEEDLTELGYQVDRFQLSVATKTIGIEIQGDEDYVNMVKAEVKLAAEQKLHSIGMDAYTIKVSRSMPTDPLADIPKSEQKKIEKNIQLSREIENEIMQRLTAEGYQIFSAPVRINNLEKFIPLELPITETRDAEIKQLIEGLLDEKNLEGFSIEIYKTDPAKQEAEMRWAPIISTIAEGLIGKKDFNVVGVGYSFYPSPLTLTITTSVPSSYSDVEELVDQIEMEIHAFIHSEEVDDSIKKDPYKIEIYSKDNVLLN